MQNNWFTSNATHQSISRLIGYEETNSIFEYPSTYFESTWLRVSANKP